MLLLAFACKFAAFVAVADDVGIAFVAVVVATGFVDVVVAADETATILVDFVAAATDDGDVDDLDAVAIGLIAFAVDIHYLYGFLYLQISLLTTFNKQKKKT